MPKQARIAALLLLAILPFPLGAQPRRLRCTSPQCRATRTWVKTHYCGQSPYGNGPADGCEIVLTKKLSPGIERIADFDCDPGNTTDHFNCKQTGNAPAEIKTALLAEMHRIGLPPSADGRVLYAVLRASADGTFFAEAYYGRRSGYDLTECQIIATVSPDGRLSLLRKLPLLKTDAEVYSTTTWFPVDIVTINGQQEFILLADAYEDHWYEAVVVENEIPRTIFAGLGYSL